MEAKRRDPIPEPPWAEIDKGIKSAVSVLYHAGITTTYSCQGGHGHKETVPTIRCPFHVPHKRIHKVLYDDGYRGFSIREGEHMTMNEGEMVRVQYREILFPFTG